MPSLRALLLVAFLWLPLLVSVEAGEVETTGATGYAAGWDDRLPQLMTQVEEALGFGFEGTIRAVFARSEEEFAELVPMAPRWAVAVARPSEQVLVVSLARLTTSPAPDIASVLRHELVHLLLPARIGSAAGYRALPRWFEEGTAQLLGGRLFALDRNLVPIAAAAGRLIPLEELTTSFPESPSSASLAYAQSESIVSFLYERDGLTGLRRFFDALGASGSFETALDRAFGLSPEELTQGWKKWIKEEGDPWWLALLAQAFLPLLFFFASLLVILAFLRARRRRRKQYEALPE